MKRIRLRSALLNGVLLLVAGLAWFYVAPAQVGGFTTYVVTHGVSMEPRFHSGDLAIVRPAGQYRVGDVVAYHSSLLRLVVLHRIVAIHNGHYTFKGDNNNFLDPVQPTRDELVGKLWLHVPRGGVVLAWLHTPVVDGLVCGVLGLTLLYGFGQQRQRRRRRRRSRSGPGRQGPPLVNTPRHHPIARSVDVGVFLAAALTVAVFVVLSVLTFASPARQTATVDTRYTQQASFRYSARVPPGLVYPAGTVETNNPIFLSIVHHLDVRIAYRFTSAAPSTIAGTERVSLELIGPSGWTRSFVLAPPTRFVGTATSTVVTLNLRHLESLMSRVEQLTGNPAFGALSVAVEPVVRVRGTLGGHPITTTFRRALTFQLASGQLQPSGGSLAASSTPGTGTNNAQTDYTQSQAGSIGTPGSEPTTITILGVSEQISLLRWLSLLGLLLSVAGILLLYLRKRGEPFVESVHIQRHHGHLIVPIVAGEDLGWPPVDVPNIKALVRLAESGQRLILHNRSGDVDTYMVNDEGTVYRYQVPSAKVVWGEWTDAPVPVDRAALAPGAAEAA